MPFIKKVLIFQSWTSLLGCNHCPGNAAAGKCDSYVCHCVNTIHQQPAWVQSSLVTSTLGKDEQWAREGIQLYEWNLYWCLTSSFFSLFKSKSNNFQKQVLHIITVTSNLTVHWSLVHFAVWVAKGSITYWQPFYFVWYLIMINIDLHFLSLMGNM